MDNKFILHASKVRKDKKLTKIVLLLLMLIILLSIFLYMVIGFVYNSGNFTITLDDNLYYDRGLIISDDPLYKAYRSELLAESVSTFDNISEAWLPDTLPGEEWGSHNGDNYIAYSFYIENNGEMTTDYYTQIVIEDVIQNVDEAVRIRIYKNGEATTYAKMGSNGAPEPNTVPFEDGEIVITDHVEDFKPKDITKYTLVIWLEGTDPQTTNNIIGGEIKMRMEFKSEFVEK